MSNSSALVELTQAALAKLRSPECNMRIVQLQSSTTSASSSSSSSSSSTASPSVVISMTDIDVSHSMWKHKWGSATSVSTSSAGGEGQQQSLFPVMLPTVLIEYYKALQSDGLHFAASVSRSSSVAGGGGGGSSSGGGAAEGSSSAVAAMSYVCSCRFNRVSEITPVQLTDMEMACLQHPSTTAGGGSSDAHQSSQPSARGASGVAPASWGAAAGPSARQSTNVVITATDDGGLLGGTNNNNTLYSPRPATARVRCFLLSPGAAESSAINGVDGPRSPICDVLLVFREKFVATPSGGSSPSPPSNAQNNNPEVWGRNTVTGRLFYLCRTIEDYIRLGCRMFWVSGWQLCFDAEQGPPEWSMPWMRMLCPGPLAQALSIAK